MSHVSAFSELAAAYLLLDAQLRTAMRLDDRTDDHAALLKRSATFLERIATHQPETAEERAEMLDFFARLRVDGGHMPLERLAAVAALALPSLRDEPVRLRSLPDPMPETFSAHALARIVVRGAGDLVVLGRNKRILAVSSDHAKRFDTTPTRLLGRHLLEIIGCGHWQVRQMQRIELALAGRSIDPAEADAARVGRMQRVLDPAGRPFAVLTVRAPRTVPQMTVA